jgi:hypothetical protein
MTSGAEIWSINRSGNQIERSKITQLKTTQNRCLRRVTGAYKRAPVAAIERELRIPPIDLCMVSVRSVSYATSYSDPETTFVVSLKKYESLSSAGDCTILMESKV